MRFSPPSQNNWGCKTTVTVALTHPSDSVSIVNEGARYEATPHNATRPDGDDAATGQRGHAEHDDRHGRDGPELDRRGAAEPQRHRGRLACGERQLRHPVLRPAGGERPGYTRRGDHEPGGDTVLRPERHGDGLRPAQHLPDGEPDPERPVDDHLPGEPRERPAQHLRRGPERQR